MKKELEAFLPEYTDAAEFGFTIDGDPAICDVSPLPTVRAFKSGKWVADPMTPTNCITGALKSEVAEAVRKALAEGPPREKL